MNISELIEYLDSKIGEEKLKKVNIEKDDLKSLKGLIAIIGDKHDINNNTIAIGKYFANNVSGAVLTPSTLIFEEGTVKIEKESIIYASNDIPYEVMLGKPLESIKEYF